MYAFTNIDGWQFVWCFSSIDYSQPIHAYKKKENNQQKPISKQWSHCRRCKGVKTFMRYPREQTIILPRIWFYCKWRLVLNIGNGHNVQTNFIIGLFFLDFSTWMHQLFMHVIQWLWYQTTKAIYRDKKVKYHLRCFFPRCNSFKKVSVEIFPFKQRRFYSIEGPRTPNIFHFYWINCPFFRVKKNIIYIIYIKKKSAPQMFFNWHHFYQNYENGKPY